MLKGRKKAKKGSEDNKGGIIIVCGFNRPSPYSNNCVDKTVRFLSYHFSKKKKRIIQTNIIQLVMTSPNSDEGKPVVNVRSNHADRSFLSPRLSYPTSLTI